MVANELVLWDPSTRTSHVLNATAAEVWHRCDGAHDLDDIVEELTVRFSVDSSVVRHDVVDLLRDLRAAALIDEARPTAPPPIWPEALPVPSAHDDDHVNAVNHHPWASSAGPFAAFHFRFALHDETLLTHDVLAPVFNSLATPDEPQHRYTIRARSDGTVRLALDGHALRRGTPASVARYLVWHINRMAVASVPEWLVLHAACVQLANCTLLLPASMNSGKSTLTASLVRSGWDYLTDEAVAIEPSSGALMPYPRAITLDRGSWAVLPGLEPHEQQHMAGEMLGAWHLPPTQIRARSVATPGPITALVFPRYQADAATSLVPLTAVEALTALLAQAFDFPALGQAGLDALSRLASLPAYRLTVDDLAEADATLRELLQERGSIER